MKRPFKRKLSWWIYQQDVELINSPSRRSQDFFILQVIFANAFTILTGGEFLTGFAIYLGVSDNLIGYIPLIGGISGISLMFSGILMDGFAKRKRLVVTLNSIIKPLLVSIALIPLIIPKSLHVPMLFSVLIIGHVLNAVLGVAVNSWFVEVIPIRIRGRYYSIRQIYAVLVMVLLPIVGGSILDLSSNRYMGFGILFIAALIFGVGESFAFSKIQDITINSINKQRIKLSEAFKIPLKHKEFMGLINKIIVFHLALYLSYSYTQVYMIRYLGLSYTFITSMIMLNAIFQVFAYSRWGKIGDRYGNAFVMRISFWFYAAQMAAWAMATKGNMYVLIPIIYIIASLSSSGFAVGSFNHRYEVIPDNNRSFYDAFYVASMGIALLIAPLIGGKIKELVGAIPYVRDNIQFGEFRIIFALSALGLIILSLYGLIKTRKENRKFT